MFFKDYVDCLLYRRELSIKDATASVSTHEKLERLLHGLYSFYHQSPLNRSNLKEAFKSIGAKVVLPARLSGTRWVEFSVKAVKHFLNGYGGLVEHLEQVFNFTIFMCVFVSVSVRVGV